MALLSTGTEEGRRQGLPVGVDQTDGVVLSADRITKRFGALTVLDNVAFALSRNEAVGIVGPNGAGKTTLLSVLMGALEPTAGSVHYLGRDVTRLAAADRCRIGIARTHQVPKSFGGMTVFENALVAAQHGGGHRTSEAYDRVIETLRLTGMLRIANRRAETLGLLDRKRLELARAVATDPKVLLLDEIGGGLTDGEAGELVSTIKVLRQRGIALVWIEHIVHVLVQVTERLVCMDNGKIVADGKPGDVMKHPDVVRAYLGSAVG
jgi:branched-chain amino acid transport system ATP-binding protein